MWEVSHLYNSEFSLFGIKYHGLQKYLTQAQMLDPPANDFNYENELQTNLKLCDK